MAKLLSLLLLVAMFVLLIPTGLVLASQNAVPGDATYPIKRKLEDVIIAVFSVHPSTRAYFRVDFSQRRFKESAALFTKGDNTRAVETLRELISQTDIATSEIINLQNQQQKKELANKMLEELKDRRKKLVDIQSQVSQQPSSTRTETVPATPTPPPVLIQVPQRQGTEVVIIVITATPRPIPRSTITPTPRPSTAPQAPVVVIPAGTQPSSGPVEEAIDNIDTAIGVLQPLANLLRSSTPANTPTPMPQLSATPTPRVIRIFTPTPRLATPTPTTDGSVFSLVGDELATPTPRPSITPTPAFTYPGCPQGTNSAQCMSEAEQAGYQNQTNAICYDSAGVALAYICLQSCGSCPP